MLSASSPSLAITGLGMTLSETSPRPIASPAARRRASMRSSSERSASSSVGVSRPLRPSPCACTITSGMAASMQVTCTPSIVSMRLPVGNSEPVTAPQASRKSRRIGAAVPATPSIPVSPSYVTRRAGVSTLTSVRERVLTLNTRTVVSPSCAGTRPCSMAKGPTPESMLPQLGRVSTDFWPTPTCAKR